MKILFYLRYSLKALPEENFTIMTPNVFEPVSETIERQCSTGKEIYKLDLLVIFITWFYLSFILKVPSK